VQQSLRNTDLKFSHGQVGYSSGQEAVTIINQRGNTGFGNIAELMLTESLPSVAQLKMPNKRFLKIFSNALPI